MIKRETVMSRFINIDSVNTLKAVCALLFTVSSGLGFTAYEAEKEVEETRQQVTIVANHVYTASCD